MPKEYNRKKKRKFKAMLYGNNKLTKQLARVSDRLMDLIYLSSVRRALYGKTHAWRVFLSHRVDAAWNCYANFRVPHPPAFTNPPDCVDSARDT